MKKLLLGFLIIITQLFFLRDYLPLINNTIVVQGQRCTCPHVRVLKGKQTLMKLFPDNLSSENVDFSEIYFENEISTSSDPMGVGTYIIEGEVIGTKFVSKDDSISYPLVKITKFRSAFIYRLIACLLIIVILLEALIIFRYINKIRVIQSSSKRNQLNEVHSNLCEEIISK